jgi:PIN domain nuclease of toxin-antitoxin system
LERAAVILLDTHALVWLVTEPRKLSRRAAQTIRRAYTRGGVGIASITLWELAMLFTKRRLQGRGTVEASVQMIANESRVVVYEMDTSIAALAAQLPDPMARDPADRTIVATAATRALPLVTADERIHAAGLCRTVW